MLTYARDLSILVDGVDVPLIKAQSDPLSRAVIISLFTWRRARPDDPVEPGHSRQGWFGDTYAEVAGDQIGSRLWLLAREKLTADTIERAREYATEALAWLVEDGVAARVSVTPERVGLSTLALNVAIHRTDGQVRDLRFADLWRLLDA